MLRAADGVRKLGSAGTACFFTDVRVVTPTMDRVAVGEPGEVLVSGPNVTPGYWQDDGATAGAFTDGWLRTGDLADRSTTRATCASSTGSRTCTSPAGRTSTRPRSSRPSTPIPAIAECAVIGVPDERWGEVGRAFVVVRAGAGARPRPTLLAHLEGRLARYKLPKSVVVRARAAAQRLRQAAEVPSAERCTP